MTTDKILTSVNIEKLPDGTYKATIIARDEATGEIIEQMEGLFETEEKAMGLMRIMANDPNTTITEYRGPKQ